MKQYIPIFILTFHGSSRIKKIKLLLDKFNLSYKFIYGLNINIPKHKKKLCQLTNKKKVKKIFQKKITDGDIACTYGHIKIYEYIKKKKIKSALILEDDFAPNQNLKNWVCSANPQIQNLDFIQFFSNSGLIYRKFLFKNKFFKIYKAYTHLPLTSCYQINLKSCEIFLNHYSCGIYHTSDYPGLCSINNIKQYFIYPLVGKLDDNHLNTSTNKKIWNTVSFFDKIKNFVPFYYFFNSIISISHLPYIFYFKNIYSYRYYRKYFLDLKIKIFLNFFTKKFILINKFLD